MQDKRTVIDKLKTTLEAMEFRSGDFQGDNLFSSVEKYSSAQLNKATNDLLNYSERICIFVPVREVWRKVPDSKTLIQERFLEVLIFIADRDYGPGEVAYWGDSTHPGVFYMSEEVTEQLAGNGLALNQVSVAIEDAQEGTLSTKNDSKDKTREVYAIAIEISTGRIKHTLQRGHRNS